MIRIYYFWLFFKSIKFHRNCCQAIHATPSSTLVSHTIGARVVSFEASGTKPPIAPTPSIHFNFTSIPRMVGGNGRWSRHRTELTESPEHIGNIVHSHEHPRILASSSTTLLPHYFYIPSSLNHPLNLNIPIFLNTLFQIFMNFII